MNEPSVIQSQQAKWMEVILLCLGIVIPIRFIPVIYQSLQFSRSTPELLINSLGGLLILGLSLGLLLKFHSIPLWILKASISHAEISRRYSELSGWLTIGIFTFGFVSLIITISTMSSVFGGQLSLWFTPRRTEIGMTEWKIWFFMSIYTLTYIPQITGALLFTFSSQWLAKLAISMQDRRDFLKTANPLS